MDVWLKDVSDFYDSQVSLGGNLICGQKLMEEFFVDKVGVRTTMAHFYDQT